MLTCVSNEHLEGCLGQKAYLTPSLQKKIQLVARCLGVGHAALTPPVEKRSQLTLSAQRPLEEPLDGGFEAPCGPSLWVLVECCADVTSVVTI